MLHLLRALSTVVEEGSLNRAAARLRLSQPALSRQMQALEAEIGGRLLERESSGVKPTALGHDTLHRFRPVLETFDAALADVRRLARGHQAELRIGYLGSAAACYLTPALGELRKAHGAAKIFLSDLSPGEQIAALRKGEIDVALIGQEGASYAREFHTRKLATLGVCAALPADHPLAARQQIALAELKNESFLSAPEADVPGRNQWIVKLCRTAGFRPRFVGEGETIQTSFSLIASEGLVAILPAYFGPVPPPGIAFAMLSDPHAVWDLLVMWQRGRTPEITSALIEALLAAARKAAVHTGVK